MWCMRVFFLGGLNDFYLNIFILPYWEVESIVLGSSSSNSGSTWVSLGSSFTILICKMPGGWSCLRMR